MADNAIRLYFSDFFEVDETDLEAYGAFNISCVADLPLFIDPFLLFNSRRPEYQLLHEEMIKYLAFLRAKSSAGSIPSGLIDRWYCFPEVRQNKMGFCLTGNSGRGLGRSFATALNENLQKLFTDFGTEKITKGSHLEKLCLIKDRVGKDTISDFTTNLIKGYLLRYTETFAKKHIAPHLRKVVPVDKVVFNYATESWASEEFDLPFALGDYVLLTPRDLLTKDDIWINKHDLIEDFSRIKEAIPNNQLRAQIDNYFKSVLPRNPTRDEEKDARRKTVLRFSELIDYYIKYKEDNGEGAAAKNIDAVLESHNLYVSNFKALVQALQKTDFYKLSATSVEETRKRILFLKDVIENKDGYRLFYVKGRPIERESDLQVAFRLTWFETEFDVNREVNNGRGPVDFCVSKGSADKVLVEMKLAKNSALKKNLEHQAKIYSKASNAPNYFSVIMYFSSSELAKVEDVLKKLGLVGSPWVITIDARDDNKPSASKAKTS